jgi:hypothetical protein
MNTFTFERRNGTHWNWDEYFSKKLLERGNWKHVDFEKAIETGVDLSYTNTADVAVKTTIEGSIYHLNRFLGFKDAIIKNIKLKKGNVSYLSPTYYLNTDELNDTPKLRKKVEGFFKFNTFFYLKASTGSFSRTVFIVKDVDSVIENLDKNKDVSQKWIMSLNVDSILYKRVGKYHPNGISYHEKHGHKGKLRYMMLIKIDSNTKSVYMYDKSVYDLSIAEYNDPKASDKLRNIIGGESTEIDYTYLFNYYNNIFNEPSKADQYIDNQVGYDLTLNAEKVFGKAYKQIIVPQLEKITKDLFEVVDHQLICKNTKYYNKGTYKCCFQLTAVDIIVDPQLHCYFLEVNETPYQDYPEYEYALEYDYLVDGLLKICVDPYIKPRKNSNLEQLWKQVDSIKQEKNIFTYYSSPKWKLTQEVEENLQDRKNWVPIIYPHRLREEYSIDLVTKRKRKVDTKEQMYNHIDELHDTVMKNGKLVGKINTLKPYLGDKKYMYDILSNDPEAFEFLPLTATFNVMNSDYSKIIYHAMNYDPSIKTWILKPSKGLQGQDIIVSNDSKVIIKHVNRYLKKYQEWVLSQYIDNPFLVKIRGITPQGIQWNDTIGRKNHVRIYVLVTKIHGDLNVYLWENNLIFFAVKEYTITDFNDPEYKYSNLTNLFLASKYYESGKMRDSAGNSKKYDGTQAYKDLSFPFEKFIMEIYSKEYYDNTIFPQIQKLLKTVFRNSVDYLYCLNSPHKLHHLKDFKGCFQYIALDIMLDDTMRVWLLEINAGPGMNAPSFHWGSLKNFMNGILDKTSDLIYNKDEKDTNDGWIKIV